MAIKNFLRTTGTVLRLGALIAVLGSMGAILVSCGGGGVAAVLNNGSSTLVVAPAAPDLYEGTPTTLTISGGKAPYIVASASTGVVPAPQVTGNTFIVTANAVTLDPTPVKLTVVDSSNPQLTLDVTVNVRASQLNNAITITPTNVGQSCGTAVCSGGDAVVTTTSSLNGALQRNRSVRFDVFQGDYNFVTPGTNTLVTTITVTTDSQGVASAIIRAKNAAPTQTAIIQVTDVTTGQNRRSNFAIQQVTNNTAITIIPSTFVWTGVYNNACVVGGLTTHYIFGGTPPYTITSTDKVGYSFAPAVVTTQGGAVTVATTGLVCTIGTVGATFIVTDATGRFGQFTIANNVGAATPPSAGGGVTLPAPTVAIPGGTGGTSATSLGPLDCGLSSSVFVTQTIPAGYTGPTPTITATSLDPNRVTAIYSSTTGQVTVTRVGNGAGGLVSTIVRISNGSTFTDLQVILSGTAPYACNLSSSTITPITLANSNTITLHLNTPGVNPIQPVTFSGGTGPYTITTAAPGIANVSTTGGGGTFTTTISLTGTSLPFIVQGLVVGVTFVSVTDSTPAALGGPLTTVLVVTVVTP